MRILFFMEKIKVIITGASGMVGKSVLNECLINSNVDSVLAINRTSLNINNPKYKELIIDDFMNLFSFKDHFEGYDACFHCMGVSSSYVSNDEYEKLTYQVTILLAKTLSEINPGIIFCYVSGVGTDKNENSKMFWANVKGKTENDLQKIEGLNAYMIRLGMLFPTKGIRSKTKSFDRMYRIMRPILFLFNLILPNMIISSESFGKALINTAIFKPGRIYLNNRDLYKIVK